MTSQDEVRAFVRRIAAFVGIGAVNTAAFFLLSNALHEFVGLGVVVSGYLAYAVLVPVSFFGHRRITFSSTGSISREWIRFCVIQAINLVVIGVVTTFSESGAIPGWLAFAAISVLIPMLNFVIFQLWVFSRRPV